MYVPVLLQEEKESCWIRRLVKWGSLLKAYEKIGGQYAYKSGKLFLCSQRASGSLCRLETGIYPGFPTDLQSIFLAVLGLRPGRKPDKRKISLKTGLK